MIKNQDYQNVYELKLKIKDYYLSKIRKDCPRTEFVKYSNKIISLLWEFVLSDLEFETKKEKSLLGPDYDDLIFKHNYTVVSIYRSAETMSNIGPLLELDNFNFGKILIQRNEGEEFLKNPIKYYNYHKFPKNFSENKIIIVDNMIGTGGSLLKAIEVVLKYNIKIEDIIFVNLICCPEALKKMNSIYPNLKIYTAQIDEKLNDKAYIEPGLGDFGDRFYGTN